MKRHRFGKSEQGLTLVESMVALVIFSTIIVMATPPIILSMASRIRSYRAQQALQIAQAQLDRAKIVLEMDVNLVNNNWTNEDKLPPDAGMVAPQAVPAPASAMPTVPCTDSFTPATASALCYVDTNKNAKFDSVDFAVQTFRSCDYNPTPITGIRGFFAGVRVYPYGSLASGQTLDTKQASLGFSAASTATRGPLAVQYRRLVKTNSSKDDQLLGDYNNFLQLGCQ